jgi:hypothetical protein
LFGLRLPGTYTPSDIDVDDQFAVSGLDSLDSAHPVTKPLTDIQTEYRRRNSRVYKALVIELLAFALTGLLVRLEAPELVQQIAFAITFLGMLVFVGYAAWVSRCPACGYQAWVGFKTLGGKCLGCGVELHLPRKSADGRRTYS